MCRYGIPYHEGKTCGCDIPTKSGHPRAFVGSDDREYCRAAPYYTITKCQCVTCFDWRSSSSTGTITNPNHYTPTMSIRQRIINLSRVSLIAALTASIAEAKKRIAALEADRNNYPKRLKAWKAAILKAAKTVKSVDDVVPSGTDLNTLCLKVEGLPQQPTDPCEADRVITNLKASIANAEASIRELEAASGGREPYQSFGELRVWER